ncbi:MAG TPA: VOC family protein [Vitreimonas sp.]|nr:VOC family protein [Vitreimonas sp.]
MSAARIADATPVLLVRDVVKAAGYYTDKLGFTVERFWGEPPTFTIARRDGVFLMLNQVAASDQFRPNGDYDGRFSVYVDVNDADALHAEFQMKGADIVCTPEDMPYMMREFQVRDLDGHLLGFGHDISRKN